MNTRPDTMRLAFEAIHAPVNDGPAESGAQSCEQTTRQIRTRHGEDRRIKCEVLEDGILGGGVRRPA
jgi:hypothetical protein